MDHINWAPCWLLVDLCFSLANRRNQQKEREERVGGERRREREKETDRDQRTDRGD